jgi:hypothetical protein
MDRSSKTAHYPVSCVVPAEGFDHLNRNYPHSRVSPHVAVYWPTMPERLLPFPFEDPMRFIKPVMQGGLLIAAALTSAGILLAPASAQTGRVFFGNLHSHTSYSDGTDTPTNSFRKARDVGLDFLAITEHNHRDCEGLAGDRADGVMIAKKPELYTFLINAAIEASETGGFVGLYGQEFSSIGRGNHLNVFEVGEVINDEQVPNGDFDVFYSTWLPAHPDSTAVPPIIQMNHPNLAEDLRPATGDPKKDSGRENDYGYDDYGKSFPSLRDAMAPYVRLIEVLSGPATRKTFTNRLPSDSVLEDDYLGYLAHGFPLAPTGNQDNHYFKLMGSSNNARTGVWATELSRRAILTALRERRCYATEDKNLEVSFTIDSQPMGSSLRMDPGPLTITVGVRDPNEGSAPYVVELLQGDAGGVPAAVIDRRSRTGDGSVSFTTFQFDGRPVFFLAKVIQGQSTKDRAWTAPIWIAPPDTVDSAATGYVWSTNSSIYHFANCRVVSSIKPENRESSATAPAGKSLHNGCPR